MRVTRLYTGPDGESHFEDVEIPLEDTGGSGRRSKPMKATGIFFIETSAEYNLDWHNAPRRQFVVTLEGEVEIVIGDGSKRRFGPGDILLAEDATGHGHISRALNNQPRKAIFITLD